MPEIAPVEVSKERPAGSVDEIVQEVIAPPLDVGVTVVIAVPFAKLNELGLYVSDDGAASLTIIVTVAVALPPVLVAVTVYVADAVIAFGVPEIVPVEVSKESPAGNVGETDHETTVPPLDVGVSAVIREPLVRVNGFPLYVIDEGMTSLTTMVTLAVELPPVLVAVTV